MSRDLAGDRLIGLDVARCLALLGMVATHVLATRGADGELTLAHEVFAGRAAALFAVLAGVTLALMTGRSRPVAGRERLARSAGIVVRALLIAAIGLILGGLGSGLAIILTYYGLLFLLGLPFLGLGATALAGLGGVWLVVAPVLSHAVRPELPPRGFDSPSVGDLADPWQLVTELMFTGYYPVVPWLSYLLAGLALGRLDLTRRDVAGRLVIVGGAVAVASYAASRLLTSHPDIGAAIGVPPDQIAEGWSGVTPTGAPWEWLLVVGPHTATPFDLAHTIGTSVLVIGLCLVAVRVLGDAGRRGVAVLFGAGTMTLTLYTLHAVMRTETVPPEETPDSLPFHLVALLGIGALYAYGRRRGPLEWVVADSSGWVASKVTPSRR